MGCRDWGLDPASADAAPVVRVLYLGRLAKEDGLFELLQDLSEALARGVRARLVIAGSGPEEERLRKCAAGLGLAEAVAFVGPAFGARRDELLAEADVRVMPGWCHAWRVA